MRTGPEPTPGDALLAADPATARHLRRARLAAVPGALLVVVQALALAQLMVALAQHGRFDLAAGVVLVVAAAARGTLSWWLDRAGRLAAAEAIGRLRSRLVDGAAILATTRPGAVRPGEIAADAVHELPAIEAYVGRFLSGRPAAVATTVVVLLAILAVDPLSALLLAPTVPLLIVFLWLVGTEAKDASQARLVSLGLLGAHLLDVLRGLTDLRAFGRARHQLGQVDAAAAAYRRETMATLRAAFLSGLVLELVAMLGTALIAVIGGVRLAGGSAELAAILPALVLAPELYAPLRRLGAGFHEAADARAALDRLAAVEAMAAAAPVPGSPSGPASPTPGGRAIVLCGVTVGEGDRAARLEEVSLAVEPGETLALVGPSGAGKSTLAGVLLGLVAPTEGTVAAEARYAAKPGDAAQARYAAKPGDPADHCGIPPALGGAVDAAQARYAAKPGDPGDRCGIPPALGGAVGAGDRVDPSAVDLSTVDLSTVDLSTVDLTPWRDGCAWVAQEPVLLPATLRENARLAAPEASDAAVLEALRAAGLGELVEALPLGLETPLGDGAARLSSGELRRLALARASLAGAELLVLDEPTAQLDALTAGRLQGTLDALAVGRTTIVITHDPAVAQRCDRIARLEGGRLVEVVAGRGTGAGAAAARGGVAARSGRAAERGDEDAARGGAEPAGGRGERVGAAARASGGGAPKTPDAPAPARPSLRAALALLRPERGDRIRGLVRRAVGLGALSALSGVAVLAISGALIVEASTRPPVLEMTSIIVLVRMFSILRATTKYGERLAGHDAALRILQRVRVGVFAQLAGLGGGAQEPTAEHDGMRTGPAAPDRTSAPGARSSASIAPTPTPSAAVALDRVVGDVDRTADLLVRVLVPAIASLATGLVAVALVAVFSTGAAAVIAGVLLTAGSLVAVAGRGTGAAATAAEEERGALAQEVVATLDAGTELLLAGRTSERRERIAARSAAIEGRAARAEARGSATAAAISVAAAGAAVLVAAALAGAGVAGTLGVGPAASAGAELTGLGGVALLGGPVAAALVLAALATVERLDGLADAARAVRPATAAVGRLLPALQSLSPVRPGAERPSPAPPTTDDGRSPAAPSWPAAETPPAASTSPVAFSVVDAQLVRGGRRILDGASFGLAPGERVAITGESGAGKSTLLLVAAGLLPSGAPNGAPGPARPAGSASAALLVPSHPHLFGGSLAANLRLADPGAGDAALRSALERVGLGPWLATLPAGLETMLGEGGATASGGQRQRLGLARAVLSPAAVVLLDEPASHLPEADALVALAAVLDARPGRSAVLVSHRAAELTLVDRTLRLEHGRLRPASPLRLVAPAAAAA